MKKLFFIILSIGLAACSTDGIDSSGDCMARKGTGANSHRISLEQAQALAIDYFTVTRGSADIDFATGYIVDEKAATRGMESSTDTLAYIFNCQDNGGFVVAAADDRLPNVLAYSDGGHFEYEEDDNNVVYKEFVERLRTFLITPSTGSGLQFGMGYKVYPVLDCSWHQRYPFDTYVIQDHPGCPVGCAAVAIGQVMSVCKSSLLFHGNEYDFRAVRAAMYHSSSDYSEDFIEHYPDPTRSATEYTYDEAADKIALLLYDIGKDIHMTYQPTGSGAYTSLYAYDEFTSYGYIVPDANSGTMLNYDGMNALSYLRQSYILLMRGSDMNEGVGHAWVIDGADYYTNLQQDEHTLPSIISVYMHCDWGWNGSANGYYCGEVFDSGSYEFGAMQFLAVKIED